MYPRICSLLLDESAPPPRTFDVVIERLKSHNNGEAHLVSKRIYLNTGLLSTNGGELSEPFQKVFVHEMTHMAVQYQSPVKLFFDFKANPDGYWGESIANYAYYKLIGTNGWHCPECNGRYPHYTSGYMCGGAFLLYVEANYEPSIVRQLVQELRHHGDIGALFIKRTGKSLDELWLEFESKSTLVRPLAADVFKIQKALGYRNGTPPKDVTARFKKYVEQNGREFTRTALKLAKAGEKPFSDIRDLLTAFAYFNQPNGSPEEALKNIRDKGELPGVAKDTKGFLSVQLNFEELASLTFPTTRDLEFHPKDDPSVYHYRMAQTSWETRWNLVKAWHTDANGKLVDEFPIAATNADSRTQL